MRSIGRRPLVPMTAERAKDQAVTPEEMMPIDHEMDRCGSSRATLVPSLPGASLWLITIGGLWFCLWRHRWRLAGLPVVAIGLLGPPPAADLLMSDDGRVLGLRDDKGVVHVASSRTDRFVADTWARRSGQEGAKRWLASADEEAAGLGCRSGLCRWLRGNQV